MKLNKVNCEQVDSYLMLIMSKYFITSQNFINITCVNSKFKETTKKLRFNPIQIKSLKLFPTIQTRYWYNENDTKIEGIDDYELLYEIDCDENLKYKENNIKCHVVVFTENNRKKYGNHIHGGITVLGKRFILPLSLTSLCNECFHWCEALTSIGIGCFSNCISLKPITIPSSITTLSDECFSECLSLTSINLPSPLKELGKYCFMDCINLELILGVEKLRIGLGCFDGCGKLRS
ncbi:Leucine rich repeat containing protein BspA family protein [Entamoeba marina]